MSNWTHSLRIAGALVTVVAVGCSGTDGAGGGGGNADASVAQDVALDDAGGGAGAADGTGGAGGGGGALDGGGASGGDSGDCGSGCDVLTPGGDVVGDAGGDGTGPGGGGVGDGGSGGGADGGGSDGGGGSGGDSGDCGSGCDVLTPGGDVVGDAGGDGTGPGPDGTSPDKSCVVDTSKGPQGDECPAGEQCVVGVGKCSGMAVGQCVTKITVCPAVVAPVCDCSGKTWPSLCDAQAGGAVVAKGGACEGPPAKKCGTIAGIGCDKGEVCDLGCGSDAEGVCVPEPPASCPAGGPVECGCDGSTWPSACARINAGVAKAYDGACKTGPQEVACKLGPVKPVLCPDSFYCKIDVPGECSGKGHCKPVPVACDEADKPVCGCDMNTYKNSCKLEQAGFSMQGPEACPK
ncbi:MAG: hypothetical protein H6747_12905 [Deltaproteobacteria bacterium]|nr:hypothetical protein [Deltaproteobacteria bacterium]